MDISFMFAKCRIHCTSVVEIQTGLSRFSWRASTAQSAGVILAGMQSILHVLFSHVFIVFSLDFEKRSYGHKLSFDKSQGRGKCFSRMPNFWCLCQIKTKDRYNVCVSSIASLPQSRTSSSGRCSGKDPLRHLHKAYLYVCLFAFIAI